MGLFLLRGVSREGAKNTLKASSTLVKSYHNLGVTAPCRPSRRKPRKLELKLGRQDGKRLSLIKESKC